MKVNCPNCHKTSEINIGRLMALARDPKKAAATARINGRLGGRKKKAS